MCPGFVKKGITTTCFLFPLTGESCRKNRARRWNHCLKWLKMNLAHSLKTENHDHYIYILMKLLLCTRICICELSLSDLSVCDISVSIKCSYMVALVQNKWIQYSWMIFQLLCAWATIAKPGFQLLKSQLTLGMYAHVMAALGQGKKPLLACRWEFTCS